MSDVPQPSSTTPRIDFNRSRYDENTWIGRFRHFVDVTDVRNLFVSKKQILEANELLKSYERNELKNVDEDELWRAKKLRDSSIHRDTEELIFAPFRLSAFAPINLLIAYGLLLPNPSTSVAIFWQWINQSYNVAVNYANRNASNHLSNAQIAESYAGATLASCSIAVGLGHVVKRANHYAPRFAGLIRMFVPFIAVGSAGALNVYLMRRNETTAGIDVKDANGRTIGTSQKAGQIAVTQTAISRVVISLPILVVPPVTMSLVRRTGLLNSMPRLALPLELAIITGSIVLGLPTAVALFPQIASIDPMKLESRFHSLRDENGNHIDRVFFNKGL